MASNRSDSLVARVALPVVTTTLYRDLQQKTSNGNQAQLLRQLPVRAVLRICWTWCLPDVLARFSLSSSPGAPRTVILFVGPTENVGANLNVPECDTFDTTDCVRDAAVRSAVQECNCVLGWRSALQS